MKTLANQRVNGFLFLLGPLTIVNFFSILWKEFSLPRGPVTDHPSRKGNAKFLPT